MVAALTNPELYASVAALITAVTALVKIFQIQGTQAAQHETLQTVERNTNGALASLKAGVSSLRAGQATPQEMSARTYPPDRRQA